MAFIAGIFIGFFCSDFLPTKQKPASDDDILFSQKNVVDTGGNSDNDFVSVIGTLTGDGVGYPSNTVTIICEKSSMKCEETMIDQIGRNQVSPIDIPVSFPVEIWTDKMIAAATREMCSKTSIYILRKTQEVQWTQQPIKTLDNRCIGFDSKIYTWEIKNPPYWAQLFSSKDENLSVKQDWRN